jgi:hypothetical protein
MKILRLGCMSLVVFVCSAANAFSQPPLRDPYHLLCFKASGAIEKGSQTDLKLLIKSREEDEPTDVFLMSHGWNNSEARARNTYTSMVELMREQGKTLQLARKMVPLVIGVSWPAQFADDKQLEEDAAAVGKLLETFGVTDKVRSGVQKVLASKFKRKILERFIDTDDLEEFIENPLSEQAIEKVFRGASYYSMKKRAGIVGETGVRQSLVHLLNSFPRARFHLVGHSFGCKVWLECLREPKLPRPVDTLVLLQGAVSHYCFADSLKELDGKPAAYGDIAQRVKGPIVITFTKNDSALGLAYPAASQIAGQFAEIGDKFRNADIHFYSALGAKGVPGIKEMPMRMVGAPYDFAVGLNTVNSDEFIKHHSDIRKAEVAWLIWSAILQK